jgi:RNA polymerase sigma-70 factor (ECF subfamily)
MSIFAREGADAPRRAARWRARFEDLARQFHAEVYSYLRWISRDAELAEDLTQETFMRIWQHPPELRDGRALRGWIYRVARNEYLQYRRRAGLTTVPFEEGEAVEAADWSRPGPEVHLAREALCRAVQEAIVQLAGPYREVIVLHNLQGLSLPQVAEVMQIPLGTVKSRRAKAFARLRELLQETVR